jgi:hypothetical protein
VNQTFGPRPSPEHSIDRIENNEGYFPSNLKWSTKSEQSNNTRRSIIEKATNTVLVALVNKSAKHRR